MAYSFRPAFPTGTPGPDPDLLNAGHGPKVVNVPVEPLASPEMSQEARQQVSLGRACVNVPAAVQPADSDPRERNAARTREPQDQAIDARRLK